MLWDELPDPLQELPTDPAERALALEQALIARARGGTLHDQVYRVLRKELMDDTVTRALLPQFVEPAGTVKRSGPTSRTRMAATRGVRLIFARPLLLYMTTSNTGTRLQRI